MAKRKREAADQELQISGRPGKVKKHKTKDAKETEITNTLKESGTVKEIRTIAQVPESEDHPTKLARKLAKQKRRALQRTRIADETVPQAIESKGTDVQKDSASNHETKAVIATKNETQLVKTKHKEKERKGKSAAWKISDPIGGQMLDLDPVFSLDEKFVPDQD